MREAWEPSAVSPDVAEVKKKEPRGPAGLKVNQLSNQPKDSPKSRPPASGEKKSDTRPNSAAFDQPLFERKLRKLVKQTQRNIEAGRRGVLETHRSLGHEFGEAYLVRMVLSDIGVLRDSFLPGVDKACRKAQRSGGNDITPGFIREELVPRVLSALNDRKMEIRGYLETFLLVAENGNPHLPSVLNHLSREMDDLRNGLKNDYEIEISLLKRQELQPKQSNEKRRSHRGQSLFTRSVRNILITAPRATGLEICRKLDDDGVKSTVKDKTYEELYLESARIRKQLDSRFAKIRTRMKAEGLLS